MKKTGTLTDEYPSRPIGPQQQQTMTMNGRRRDNDLLVKQQQQGMNGNKAEMHIQALSQMNHRLAKELVS
jgi:hypothetical protein